MNVWHIFLADIFQSSSLSFDFIRSFLFNFLDVLFMMVFLRTFTLCDHIFLFGRLNKNHLSEYAQYVKALSAFEGDI